MGSVRVAIAGVGNCAASLVQGVEYYKDADPSGRVPGLMHVQLGDYHVRDVSFVAAFDVDAKKVGQDLAHAIVSSENNTIKIADVPPTDITVLRGPTLEAHVGPLAVVEPSHVVGRANVNVVLAQVMLHLRGDRLRLGDLLRL